MTKRFLCLLMAIAVLASAYAADASWLKISTKDGNHTMLAADGLIMTVDNGMLVCTGSTDEISLALDQLATMEFTSGSSGVALLSDAAEEAVDVFTTSAIHLGSYPTLQQARESLAGKSGAYILKTKSQTFKITVR